MAENTQQSLSYKGWTLFIVAVLVTMKLLVDVSNNYPQYAFVSPPGILSSKERAIKIKAVAVGNSHRNAIDFNSLETSGEDFGLSGVDIFETVYLLDQLIPEIESVDTVYMPISYPLLHLDNAVTRPSARLRSYHLLPCVGISCFTLINGDFRNRIVSWLLPLTRFDNWEQIIISKLSPGREKASKWVRVQKSSKLTDEAITRRAKHHLMLASSTTAKTYEEAIGALRSLVRHLGEHEVDIVFFTPPYHPKYMEVISTKNPSLIPLTHRAIADLIANRNIFYRDYNFADIGFPLTGFRNADHLNVEGMEIFSKALQHDLRHFR